MVRIVERCVEFDQRAIAGSIEHQQFFYQNCWHFAVLFAHVRRIGKTTSSCERWAHDLKCLYDPVQGPATTTMVTRLVSRCAGLRGDGTDEVFVSEVSRRLQATNPRDNMGLALFNWRKRQIQNAHKRGTHMSAPETVINGRVDDGSDNFGPATKRSRRGSWY